MTASEHQDWKFLGSSDEKKRPSYDIFKDTNKT